MYVQCRAGGAPSMAVASKDSVDRGARRGRWGASGSLNTHREAACAPPALPPFGAVARTQTQDM